MVGMLFPAFVVGAEVDLACGRGESVFLDLDPRLGGEGEEACVSGADVHGCKKGRGLKVRVSGLELTVL